MTGYSSRNNKSIHFLFYIIMSSILKRRYLIIMIIMIPL